MERKARSAFKACCCGPVARLAEPKLTPLLRWFPGYGWVSGPESRL